MVPTNLSPRKKEKITGVNQHVCLPGKNQLQWSWQILLIISVIFSKTFWTFLNRPHPICKFNLGPRKYHKFPCALNTANFPRARALFISNLGCLGRAHARRPDKSSWSKGSVRRHHPSHKFNLGRHNTSNFQCALNIPNFPCVCTLLISNLGRLGHTHTHMYHMWTW